MTQLQNSTLLKVLITVKTYPIPSKKYDELVCTAGVTESGDFVRLYPINFRDLPYSQQYVKYQWIEVEAQKHKGRDTRKESFRPNSETIRVLGKPIPANPGNWSTRAVYVLKNAARSMEDLYERKKSDNTSLGIFRPKLISRFIIEAADSDWKPEFKAAMMQARLWDDRTASKQPPRKVPFKFSFSFECDDSRCNRKHKMMIEDWEVGSLFWRMVDKGFSPEAAAQKVKQKFMDEICNSKMNTYFYVGTVLAHGTWVVIGTFYPKMDVSGKKSKATSGSGSLFDELESPG